MPFYYEIESAFWAAIQIAPDGKKTVKTEDFLSELGKVNCHWSLEKANQWIEMSVSTFKDVSTQDGENRTFMLFNPNGGL